MARGPSAARENDAPWRSDALLLDALGTSNRPTSASATRSCLPTRSIEMPATSVVGSAYYAANRQRRPDEDSLDRFADRSRGHSCSWRVGRVGAAIDRHRRRADGELHEQLS